MPESLVVSAPATSANLGPGFDALAVALDLSNAVVVRRRSGPLEVRVTGEGAGEVPEDETNLVCRAMRMGLASLDGLEIECRNRIPLGRGLGSSAATVCAGLVAANALGGLRWSPADLLARAAEVEGHADNAAACLEGGMVVVRPGPGALRLAVQEDLCFVASIPVARVSTTAARRALPDVVPMADAAGTVASAVGLALTVTQGRLDELGDFLHDRLHEPYREALVPGLPQLRGLADGRRCFGATISGSGPTTLIWCTRSDAEDVAADAREALAAAGVDAHVRVSRIAATGVRARWTGVEDTTLERSIG